MSSIGELGAEAIASALKGDGLRLSVGPATTLIRSPLTSLARDIHDMYSEYPQTPPDSFVHQSVALLHSSWLRRWIRPKILISGEYPSPLLPVKEDIAFVAMEMSVNWHMAMIRNRHLVFHASSVADERGRSVIMPGASGSGKSTLASGLGYGGWRFMGDEFVLLDMEDCRQVPYPRPISLKNESIAAMKAVIDERRFSRLYANTFKGDVKYLKPPKEAILNQVKTEPRLILFPTFDASAQPEITPCPPIEALTRMVSASVNYWKLGRPAFQCLTDLCSRAKAFHIRFSSQQAGAALVEEAFAQLEGEA